MNSKPFIWAGLVVGSLIGGFIPALWGASSFSISAIILSTIGGIAGIWAGFELSQN